MDLAVKAAREAFEAWRLFPAPRRGEILFRAAEILFRKKESLGKLETREMGKVISEGLGDVQEAIDMGYYMAGEGRRLSGETVPSELPNKDMKSVRVPVGLFGLITPWNFPIAIPAWKVFPALICANTVVLKPSSDTSACAAKFVEALVEAGLPKGVLNLVHGPGGEVGEYLVRHPGVNAISFTGSFDTGKRLDITTNRVDCMNVYGVAREVAALYGLPLRPLDTAVAESGEPAAGALDVAIEAPDLCGRFCARLLDVKVGPSPAWLRDRLELVGIRSTSNLVDLTNYVMVEMGQPSHAFDLARVPGGKLVVRWSREGERLVTLDGSERTLPPRVGVIAGEGGETALALAGIMGGASSEISEATRVVALEAAWWESLAVRRGARALGGSLGRLQPEMRVGPGGQEINVFLKEHALVQGRAFPIGAGRGIVGFGGLTATALPLEHIPIQVIGEQVMVENPE